MMLERRNPLHALLILYARRSEHQPQESARASTFEHEKEEIFRHFRPEEKSGQRREVIKLLQEHRDEVARRVGRTPYPWEAALEYIYQEIVYPHVRYAEGAFEAGNIGESFLWQDIALSEFFELEAIRTQEQQRVTQGISEDGAGSKVTEHVIVDEYGLLLREQNRARGTPRFPRGYNAEYGFAAVDFIRRVYGILRDLAVGLPPQSPAAA